MPILNIQRRLVEVGRVRLGDTAPTKGGKTRPVRLETWKLTSRDPQRLGEVAALYGGEVTPWPRREGEFQVLTGTKVLDVAVMPATALSAFNELWGQIETEDGKGAFQCLRRCNGHEELLRQEPCLCQAEMETRKGAGPQCKPLTQLNVLLPRVPGLGSWRLKTTSYYAAMELAGTVDLLQALSATTGMVGARLRIDKRRAVRDGKTTVFPVPVLDLDTSLLEVAAGEAPLAYRPIDGSARALEVAGAPAIEPPAVIDQMPSAPVEQGEPEPQAKPKPSNGRRTQAPVGEEAPLPEPPGPVAASEPPDPTTEIETTPAPDVVDVPVMGTVYLDPNSGREFGSLKEIEEFYADQKDAKSLEKEPGQSEPEATQAEEAVADRAARAIADAEPQGESADLGEAPPKPAITRADRNRLFLRAREVIGVQSPSDPKAELRKIIRDVTGKETTGSMTQAEYDEVSERLEAWEAIPFGGPEVGEQGNLAPRA